MTELTIAIPEKLVTAVDDLARTLGSERSVIVERALRNRVREIEELREHGNPESTHRSEVDWARAKRTLQSAACPFPQCPFTGNCPVEVCPL